MSQARRGATLERRTDPAADPRAPRRAARPASASAWTTGGLRVVIVIAVLSLLVLWFAWYGCARTVSWKIQVRWIGLGVLACVVNALGCLVWLSTAVRSLRRERARTTADLRTLDLPPPEPARAAVRRSEGLVTGERMRRYHRTDCPLMATKTAQSVTAESAAARGLSTCGVCQS